MRRTAPRPFAEAIGALTTSLAPATPLARVQEVWEPVVGAVVAQAAQPTSEHSGRLTVSCSSAVWAQELSLLESDLVDRLNRALGEELISALRCRTS